MNPKANGQLQKEWGLLIAAYLFLGGVGGGAYTIAAINGFLGKEMEASTQVGLWIGFPALLVGSLCLLADLGSPMRAVRAGMKAGTSWIARGFWIISAFIALSFAHLLLFQASGYRLSGEGASTLAAISALGVVTAVGTMAYTGLLLGASKGIPFWRSGVVPVVFVVSALVTGHFALMLGSVLVPQAASSPEALRVMGVEAAALVVLEVLAILFYLHGAWREPDARESAQRLLSNRMFVVGYIVLGLGAPLILMIYAASAKADAGQDTLVGVCALGALLGLVGGLVLRWAVLQAGALPTWNLAGFEFRRNPKPATPKPQMGLVPPS
jgi:formate-dependent nitrite reductase membrane component NrfD